jgi:glycosyltransferase involved in cell wall biosynthesis
MRVGKAPTRLQKTEYRPGRVTICVPVFIPEQFGYYQQRLDILKICVASIVNHTSPETYDLLVFDNGSCHEVVDYLRSLHEQRIVQYLFLSRSNVGVANATKIMLRAAPGEIVAFSNDDVFFHPGWLEAHLEILETFPRVGMVSGFCGEQRQGTGRDIVLEHKGIKAYSTAKHFQFVAEKSVILRGLDSDWYPKAMGGQREMDRRIDALGYARLTTFKRYVQHMGNVLTPDFLDSLPATVSKESIAPWVAPRPFLTRLARLPIAHSILSRLNTWSYNLLKVKPVE